MFDVDIDPGSVGKKKLAVVLFNLGGPCGPRSVRPFLFNLFRDPAIIGLPNPFRVFLAGLISWTRAPSARRNYAKMGGGSPLRQETEAQAGRLTELLAERGVNARCFIAMRYWKPFVAETARQVAAWNPAKTILLPLYPQFSTTTTGSSLAAWRKAGGGAATTICCYPTIEGLARAHAERIVDTWQRAGSPEQARILFSAHGLPETVVKRGDPYQWQVDNTVAAIVRHIGSAIPGSDHRVCYQSRVGPLKWIGPSTEEAINRAMDENRAMLVCPVAFVGEHIETLVELDEEYREIADARGGRYFRVPALSLSETFIAALADLVMIARARKDGTASCSGARLCPASFDRCPMPRPVATSGSQAASAGRAGASI